MKAKKYKCEVCNCKNFDYSTFINFDGQGYIKYSCAKCSHTAFTLSKDELRDKIQSCYTHYVKNSVFLLSIDGLIFNKAFKSPVFAINYMKTFIKRYSLTPSNVDFIVNALLENKTIKIIEVKDEDN